MTCSRPRLSWIVTKLSQHLSKPTKTDWMIVKHVLRYVKGTLDFKLAYQKSKNGLQTVGLSDYFTLNEGHTAVSWKSKKQRTVALSSFEAEYMALTATTQEAIFLSILSKDFGLLSSDPVCI